MQQKTKQIYYVGFYSDETKENTKRYSVPAAVNKMNYISKTFTKLGCNIQIVSPSWIIRKNKHLTYFPSKTCFNNNGIQIKYSPSFTPINKTIAFLSHSFSFFWLFFYITKNSKKDTIIVLYHSTSFYLPILWAKRIRRFKLILEVEEVYHLFTKSNKKRENALFSLADGYMFSNKRIKEYLVKDRDKEKPFIIINGVYDINLKFKKEKKQERFIKVVFAGNIESTRKGAFNSVACAKYLSNKYKLYIIGFGNSSEIRKLVDEIKKVNAIFGYDKCVYLGVKHGDEYDQFLSSCDIAINPQEANETYMQFAFPSKIISYLSHNLKTVSTKLQAITDSYFSDLVTLVSNPTPQNFAKAIMNIDTECHFNAIPRIKKANTEFTNDLKHLINSFDIHNS